jgi:hypothetical protein
MDKYQNYLRDNILLLIEKIEELKQKENDDFVNGQLLAYYDVITIFKEQAKLFDIKLEEIGLNSVNEDSILIDLTKKISE